jgi:hypothetical protein
LAKRVFISYRRDDTGPVAGRIYDRLSLLLSKPNVFFDVATIKGGENFEKSIVDAIGKCDGALVFIGDKWLEASPPTKSRIWNDKDYVRAEVREALGRPMTVLPILVAGTRMPDQENLPEDIRDITLRNALPLRHESFDDDAENIVAAILGRSQRARDWEKKRGGPLSKLAHAAAGIVAACAALLAAALAHFFVFDRALSASIGAPMTTLLGIAAVIFGAAGGLVYGSRRRPGN